jgi:hypothetical protein
LAKTANAAPPVASPPDHPLHDTSMSLTRITIARLALALSRRAFATAPQTARRAHAIAQLAIEERSTEIRLARRLKQLS